MLIEIKISGKFSVVERISEGLQLEVSKVN